MDRIENIEQRALGAVLILAGLVCLGGGVQTPRAHPVELVLGVLFVVCGMMTQR